MCRILFTHSFSACIIATAIGNCKREFESIKVGFERRQLPRLKSKRSCWHIPAVWIRPSSSRGWKSTITTAKSLPSAAMWGRRVSWKAWKSVSTRCCLEERSFRKTLHDKMRHPILSRMPLIFLWTHFHWAVTFLYGGHELCTMSSPRQLFSHINLKKLKKQALQGFRSVLWSNLSLVGLFLYFTSNTSSDSELSQQIG